MSLPNLWKPFNENRQRKVALRQVQTGWEVSDTDPVKNRVRLKRRDQEETDWVHVAQPFTGFWRFPDVGEQVLLLAPYGDERQGLACMAFYSSKTSAPADDPQVECREYKNGSSVKYHNGDGLMEIDLTGSKGDVIIQCGTGTIAVTAGEINLTGMVNITGNLNVTGSITGSTISNGSTTLQATDNHSRTHTHPYDGGTTDPPGGGS